MSYWQNGTATDYQDMLDQLVEMASSDHLATVDVIVAGGTGYAVGDIITFTDGTFTHAASLEVTTVAAGVITGVRVNEGGAYTVDPDLTANASHTNDGAGNDDATFDMSMHDSSVQTAVVNAGGTGYAVNDILTVAGGTSSTAATIIVTSVAAGVIDGVRVAQGGLYSADPSLTANAVTGGGGSSATIDLTMGGQWRVERRSQEAVSATIQAGGTGYTVGDDITLTDDGQTIRGDVSDTGGVAAVFNVDTVSAGAVTGVSLITAGNYEEVPADPVAVTGGTGNDDCTLNVTFQDAATQDQVLIMESVGDAGSDEIIVGFKTFNREDVSTFETVFNWALFGMTGFNVGLPFHQQPQLSPGVESSGVVSTTGGGAFVPLKDSDAFNIEFWISTRPNRIICAFKVEDAIVTHYASMYLGFHNPFGTDAEEPYPIYVAGCTGRDNSLYTDTVMGRVSGLTECMTILNRPGPAFIRVNGVWTAVTNGTISDGGSPTRTARNVYTVYPYGRPVITAPDLDDLVVVDNASGLQWDDFIPQTGIPGSPGVQLQPTTNTGDDVRVLIAAGINASDVSGGIFFPVGELDSVFWFTAVGAITSEDRFPIGADRYRIFQNGNQAQVFSFMAIREE